MIADWLKIQKSPEYWDYKPQDRAIIKAAWFNRNVANTKEYQSYSDDDKAAIVRGFSTYGDDVSPERTFFGTIGDIGPAGGR